jgi:hypothetical protein
MHGKGLFKFPDGRHYDGEYKTNKKHGYGIFTWPSKRQYSGNWRMGR